MKVNFYKTDDVESAQGKFLYTWICMYNHTRDYLHAHTHTQNRGKDKQNITTKLYISASSI